jgi:uncharacterized protein
LSDMNVWSVTTGEAGMRSQALGLAEALGFPFEERRIRLRRPWSWLPGHLCPFPLIGLDSAHDPLAPPWPDILITCGRRSTAVSIAIRKRSKGKTLTVHLQNPQTPLSAFDLVVAHPHDGIEGENVLLVETALHRVTPEILRDARARFAPIFGDLPSPRLGVLLGGRTKNGGFRASDVEALLRGLDDHLAQGGSILITPSRRTEAHVTAALRERYAADARVFLWDGSGENPYFGILAFSDRMLVTADSVSMISEAIGTGLPVAVFPLEGLARRHKLLLDRLHELGHVLRFGAPDPVLRPPPLPSATIVAAERIRAMLAERRSRAAIPVN